MHLRLLVGLLFLTAATFAPSANAQTFTGNIATADQFDVYDVNLNAGDFVRATLVCDEVTPGSGNRPLDPTLAVYFPGNANFNEPTPLAFNLFNDDGFGTDDDPNGVDCNAFDSSIVQFSAPGAGLYRFRADGFGSATGPYTLTITAASSVPTLSQVGVAILVMLIGLAAAVGLRRSRT